MKEIFSKISSYNLFNYLFPGVIFSVFIAQITSYKITFNNVIIDFIIFYFIGLVISRIGSLIIEPLLIKIKYLKFASYDKFIQKSLIDEKIEILSEQNNMYRNLCTSFILIFLLKLYEIVETYFQFKEYTIFIIVTTLLIIFIFSYRKQTKYIRERIESNEEKKIIP